MFFCNLLNIFKLLKIENFIGVFRMESKIDKITKDENPTSPKPKSQEEPKPQQQQPESL